MSGWKFEPGELADIDQGKAALARHIDALVEQAGKLAVQYGPIAAEGITCVDLIETRHYSYDQLAAIVAAFVIEEAKKVRDAG